MRSLKIVFVTCVAGLAFTQLSAQEEAAQPPAMTVNQEHPLLPIGSSAPDFSLKGTDDKIHTLAEFSKAKLLVVIFESIHCPVSENYEARVDELYKTYHDQGVAFVAINPNNPAAVRLDELGYTNLTDSPADMKIRARDRNIPWPFLYDGETQETVQKFGAVATPHIFIFDQQRKLRYEGRIDDNLNQALVKVHDARDAIDALLTGKQVAVPHRPAFGCSTKWLSKSQDVAREWAKILEEPVTLTPASLDDIKTLRANATGNVTVVHFWNTDAKNGNRNFGDLETSYRMYRGRAFTFVTVNTDASGKPERALEFLKGQHASNKNLQIKPADLKAVQLAFGETWQANEEYTVVIAPGGKVVYSRKGPIDILDVRLAVLTSFTDSAGFAGQVEYWAKYSRR